MFWYIICGLHDLIDTDDELGNFIASENIDQYENNLEIAIVTMYFAFTSLSTVGFGDYHPWNNFERAVCALILLFGNLIFGYIIGNFNEMI